MWGVVYKKFWGSGSGLLTVGTGKKDEGGGETIAKTFKSRKGGKRKFSK